MKATFQDGSYETYSDKCKIYVNHKPMLYCVNVNSDNTKDLSLDREFGLAPHPIKKLATISI